MSGESYTPGHTENATAFMAGRTFVSHGQFFAPYLEPGLSVLDCGCGPGTITSGIAERVAPGQVTGIDFGESQIEIAQQSATANVSYQTDSCYELSFTDASFDRVFSHALLEHLNEPEKAFTEFHRVLKPGGIAGICCPDWGGFIFAPESDELTAAVKTYRDLQTANGGDVEAGRKLGEHMIAAGFQRVQLDACAAASLRLVRPARSSSPSSWASACAAASSMEVYFPSSTQFSSASNCSAIPFVRFA
ncbi:MAG: methyltransferase domain-containing protein [Limisphaerales bacterium]